MASFASTPGKDFVIPRKEINGGGEYEIEVDKDRNLPTGWCFYIPVFIIEVQIVVFKRINLGFLRRQRTVKITDLTP
jgi:hypothetical protein